MFKIAIDGPAGAGKSTIAKIIAKELNTATYWLVGITSKRSPAILTSY